VRLPGIVTFAFLALSAPMSPHFVPASAVQARAYSSTCGGDTYVNSRGHCVHRPARANRPPAGASARCRDGSYSFSESHRGTCSWHGGVATWL
jgi:hypothetical protein